MTECPQQNGRHERMHLTLKTEATRPPGMKILQQQARFRARALKEAMHELGHTFGLGHCTDPGCVMWFSSSLAETDRKGAAYCPRCTQALRLMRGWA